ncbi:MAG: Valine-tRNA ligase, partial [Parcubacteria group bacterium GW2011_GWA2_53_21]
MVHDWPESGASPLLFSSEGGSASGGKEGKGVVREQMQHLQDVIVAIRNLRSENNVEARKKVVVTLVSQEAAKMLDEQKALIHGLARVESLTISSEKVKPGNSASTVVGTTEVYLSLEGLVDMDAERDRLVGELEEARTFEAKTKVKLDNKEFISYAP